MFLGKGFIFLAVMMLLMEKKFCELNYVCWSAPVDNLGEWEYEGVIYDKNKDPLCKNGERELYAPDVAVGSDGWYYLYYAFDFQGIISVAVCDTPAGEYEFYGHVHYRDKTLLGKKDGDAFQFDPGILVDDDG
jgi:beta-xylosidase